MSTPPGLPMQLDGFDLEGMRTRLDLEEAELRELLATLPEALEEAWAVLQSAGPSDEALRRAAHGLAGVAGNYGAMRVWAMAKDIEGLARDGRGAEAAPMLAALQAEVAAACAAVRAAL